MAKRKYTPRKKNMEPAVMTFFVPAQITIPPGGAATVYYCDLSQMASVLNRRFYRQGLNWSVAGIKFQSGLNSGSIEVSKLPNTWVMANSYTKGFEAWQRMNREALEETDSVRPKFLDFKIFADPEHHGSGFANNLRPASATPSALSIYDMGEWVESKVHIPNATATDPTGAKEFDITATGANTASTVSLIEGYAASRGLPYITDPNVPDDAARTTGALPQNWIGAMFNEGNEQTEEVLEDMLADNNQAPYPFENGANVQAGSLFPDPYQDTMYPGGANQGSGLQLHDSVYYSNTAETVSQVTYMKGGNFPCGLIKISCVNKGTSQAAVNMIIDLVPGYHRGYHCETMMEM